MKTFKIFISVFLIIGVVGFVALICRQETSDEPTVSNPFSGTRYLAFGASETHGNWLEDSYPELVAEELGCKGYSNRGLGGSTYVYQSDRGCITDTVVSTLNSVGHYDIISVAGGGNDHDLSLPLGTIDDTTKESVYGSLDIIAKALKTRQKDSFVFFMTPLMSTSERVNYANYRRKDIANAVIAVGEKYGIPVLDLYSTSNFENVECGMNHPDCDGTHPIQEFMDEYLAPQIVQFIRYKTGYTKDYTVTVDKEQNAIENLYYGENKFVNNANSTASLGSGVDGFVISSGSAYISDLVYISDCTNICIKVNKDHLTDVQLYFHKQDAYHTSTTLDKFDFEKTFDGDFVYLVMSLSPAYDEDVAINLVSSTFDMSGTEIYVW